MRTLGKKYLGGLELKEDVYKVDLAILDRYQSFSAELLRLALLGVAGYGFLISSIVFKTAGPGQGAQYSFFASFMESKEWLVAGAIALGLCAMAALGHRYFSTDCIAHFVRGLRLSQQNEDEKNAVERAKRELVIDQEEASLGGDLVRCKWLLILACLFLATGTICFAGAVAVTLFSR